MIPSIWVRLDSLPMTPNGKLDRAALPAPDITAPQEQAFAAPKTPLEESLASIWAEVLKLDRVSRDSDLFSLGANSIHLFQIAARANRKGIRLSARQLLDHRTVAALAALLETEAGRPSAVAESRPNPLRRLYPISAKRAWSNMNPALTHTRLSDADVAAKAEESDVSTAIKNAA